MQRRYAIIAAIALVALVLIPAAALALGPGGGFGHRGTGLGPKNSSQTSPDCAGNATAPNWTAGNHTPGGHCTGDLTGGQNQTRTQVHDHTFALNRTRTNSTAGSPGPRGCGGRGLGR